MSDKTFATFLTTDIGRQACATPVHDRIATAGPGIKSRNDLTRWAKERYPDHYHSDPRKDTGKPFGRGSMDRLWADYLAWSEGA